MTSSSNNVACSSRFGGLLSQPPCWDKRDALVQPLKVMVERGVVDLGPTGAVPLLKRHFSMDSTILVRRSIRRSTE